MTTHTALVSRTIDAPLDAVSDLLGSAAGLTRWAPPDLRPRRVLAVDAPHRSVRRFVVRLHGGYAAEAALVATGAGATHLSWTPLRDAGWRTTRPGRLARLRRALATASARLAAYAEDPPQTRAEWSEGLRSGERGRRAA